MFAFVDCATVELDVREGRVTFDVDKGWLPFPPLTPTNLAALLAYALRFWGPDCGL
jgi:hypothetical protein